MIVGDIGDIYDIVVKVLGNIVLFGGAVGVLVVFLRWIRRQLRPATLVAPAVVLGTPWYQISTVPHGVDLTRLWVGFRGVQNAEAATTVRDVVAGVRRKDTWAECAAPDFKVAALGPGERSEIPGAETPQDLYYGLSDPTYKGLIALWARFSDAAMNRWEVVYDPAANTHSYKLLERA